MLGRRLDGQTGGGRVFVPRRPHTAADHLGVERFLVAEVVVDRRDIRPGALADLPHGGTTKAALGEDLRRGVEQLLARRRSSVFHHRQFAIQTHV